MPYCSCFVAPLSRVEREREKEKKPALCCCGASGGGCHLSFVGSVSLGFLFVSCVVCCFYDSCFLPLDRQSVALRDSGCKFLVKSGKRKSFLRSPFAACLPARLRPPPACGFLRRESVRCVFCVRLSVCFSFSLRDWDKRKRGGMSVRDSSSSLLMNPGVTTRRQFGAWPL